MSQESSIRPSKFFGCIQHARRIFVFSTVAAFSLCTTSPSQATSIISQWNWNGVTLANIGVPTTGTTGTYAGVLTTGTILSSASGPTGSPTDPLGASPGNWAALAGNYPAATAPSGTDGFGVTSVNTNGSSQVQVGVSLKVGRNASRYWQIFASTDGTTWNPVSGGIGAVTNIGSGTEQPVAVSISNSGLISFTANNAAFANSNPSGYASFTYTLPTGQGYENSSTFGFRVLSVWDPSGTSYVAASPSGTYAGTGGGTSILLDMVTVTAIPEPASIGIFSMGLGFVTLMRRRAS